jgi:hypothetical protein
MVLMHSPRTGIGYSNAGVYRKAAASAADGWMASVLWSPLPGSSFY